MKRLFIGIKINPNKKLLDFYFNLKASLKDEKIKWVPAENFHITLKFLGDTSPSLIPQIVDSLNLIIKDFQKFTLEINGLGCFKKHRRTNVIWLGLKNTQLLETLAKKVDEAMLQYGFERETRALKAHLTLGRVKFIANEKQLDNLIYEFGRVRFQNFEVTEIILFESMLHPVGPKYIVANRMAL